jgi:hypothetical protein
VRSQYLRLLTESVIPRPIFQLICLTAVISTAVAAPALGAPAGDEYLPKVPKAAGSAVGGKGSGSTIFVPEARGTKNGDGGSRDQEAGSADREGSGNDSSDATDTIFDPVVLLLIAGVIAAVAGMVLRRRHSRGSDSGPERVRRDQADAPRTPDGEIVSEQEPTIEPPPEDGADSDPEAHGSGGGPEEPPEETGGS